MSGETGKEIKRSNVIELWGDKYPEVTRWLGKLQQKSANCYYLYRYCNWAGMTPTELLALRNNPENPTSKQAEKLLDDFVNADTPELTNPIKFNVVTAVKSFYKHNYLDLAKACGAITLIQQKEHHKPRKEDLLKLWNYAQNLRDKSLITFVNSTALAKETMSKLELRYFEEGWEQKELPCINCPSEILKGHGVGRYKGVRQITFLTPEAKRDFLTYKEWIEKHMGRKLELTDRIWRNICKPYEPLDYNRLGTLIVELSREAGVDFSWHDGRRMVETSLEEVGIHPNWARKIRGRKVRGEEAPYSKPEIEKLRGKFREAVPLLQFTSEAKVGIEQSEIELLARKQALLIIAKNAGYSEHELNSMFANVSLQDGVKKLEAAIEKKGFPDRVITFDHFEKQVLNDKSVNCSDGKHCQRVVAESELETLLTEGWRVVMGLPSGKIVVSNE